MGNFAENLNLGNRFRPPPQARGHTTQITLTKKRDIQYNLNLFNRFKYNTRSTHDDKNYGSSTLCR